MDKKINLLIIINNKKYENSNKLIRQNMKNDIT